MMRCVGGSEFRESAKPLLPRVYGKAGRDTVVSVLRVKKKEEISLIAYLLHGRFCPAVY